MKMTTHRRPCYGVALVIGAVLALAAGSLGHAQVIYGAGCGRKRGPGASARGRNPHLTKWRQCRHWVASTSRLVACTQPADARGEVKVLRH